MLNRSLDALVSHDIMDSKVLYFLMQRVWGGGGGGGVDLSFSLYNLIFLLPQQTETQRSDTTGRPAGVS